MRAVVDPGVLVSAAISRVGAPAQLLQAWRDGAFELVVSPLLLAELERVLAYPKVAQRVADDDAEAFAALVGTGAMRADPDRTTYVSAGPGDDYLVGLAEAADAVLVSGDGHLLALAPRLPVFTPREFLSRLR